MIRYIIVISFLSACNKQCTDKYFIEKFDKTIKVLEQLKSNGITQYNTIDSIKIASQIITTLTGIRPHISYDYTVVYHEKDFQKDSAQWYKWYEENKCKVTKKTFDDISFRIRSNYEKDR